MHIVFMSEMVLSHLSSIVESCFSSLLLMHGQIVSRGNSTGLGHINILLDLSSTKDYRMLLYMIGIIEKMLGLWDANSFFPLLIVTNFIRPYLHQFSIDSHGLNGYGKPLKRPFDRYQSRLEAINNGRDIRQINW